MELRQEVRLESDSAQVRRALVDKLVSLSVADADNPSIVLFIAAKKFIANLS
jgi:hypothetical protein